MAFATILAPRYASHMARHLVIVPVTFREASAFTAAHHRHHPVPPRGHKASIGAAIMLPDGSREVIAVAILGRPSARHLDDGETLEVTRLTIAPGTPPELCAASFLYGAAARLARALGYPRLITFTEPGRGESGASLRAAGYEQLALLPPRPGWRSSSAGDPARRDEPSVLRARWERRERRRSLPPATASSRRLSRQR